MERPKTSLGSTAAGNRQQVHSRDAQQSHAPHSRECSADRPPLATATSAAEQHAQGTAAPGWVGTDAQLATVGATAALAAAPHEHESVTSTQAGSRLAKLVGVAVSANEAAVSPAQSQHPNASPSAAAMLDSRPPRSSSLVTSADQEGQSGPAAASTASAAGVASQQPEPSSCKGPGPHVAAPSSKPKLRPALQREPGNWSTVSNLLLHLKIVQKSCCLHDCASAVKLQQH